MSARAWAILGLLFLVWGGSFIFTELLLTHVGPVTVAFGRVAVAAAGPWALAALRGKAPAADVATWSRYIFGGAITFAAPFLCFAVAQGELTAGLTAIINAMTPVMVVIVSHFYPGGERATALKTAGVVVGFLGAALLVGPDAAAGGFSGPLFAQLIALCGPIFYGFAGNYTRVFAKEDPTVTVTGTMTGAALVLAPAALLIEGPPAALPWDAAAAFLGIGLLSTAFAFRLFYAMVPVVGATNFATVTFLVPISAIALGAVLLGERIAPADLLGMAVIFIGLLLIDGRPARWVASQAAAR